MKTLILCAGMLFFCLLLGGCSKRGPAFTSYGVDITNCVATPDKVTVHENDQVVWQPGGGDQHDYTIRFADTTEPTKNPFTVKHGVSNTGHPIRGKKGCTPLGNGEFYCEYSITRDNEPTACADPGVRVIP